MKKAVCYVCCAALLISSLVLGGCKKEEKKVKIGVSFGVGQAIRWQHEKEYMEAHAKKLGIDMEVRLNTTDKPTQQEDCKELIDSGIDVLILTPRDVNNVKEVLEYAKKKAVKVISYARVVLGESVDLFVGYDSIKIGQMMGQYLSEKVFKGDYIILQGDKGDNNAKLLYDGIMKSLDSVKKDINILIDKDVPGWSPDEAKVIVKEAIAKNGGKVDAILAPNDKIAGACAEALTESGVTNPVAITGMDAEVDAAKRIIAGTQDCTIYMDLKMLAETAVDEAVHMAKGEKVNVNSKFDNQTKNGIDANLITGQLVTKENLDRILIDSGCFTREEIYGQ